ncbi:hypothetical protein [Sporomusa malonica]|uniref:Uncharacterized protein n=1 Tax=Sporomusa malonica TaxID=112901 RepID=A0A1W2EBV1_9FIRM|nr:hypothetical protein [Sporomusa malonica]SMD07191.1 hypothetical protein SAMN04488500_1232 [Sporomusa malonica]
MWRINEKGEKEFSAGKKEWTGAAAAAESCLAFHSDVEEEAVADEIISCYNCRFRRWTRSSFICCNSTTSSPTSKT